MHSNAGPLPCLYFTPPPQYVHIFVFFSKKATLAHDLPSKIILYIVALSLCKVAVIVSPRCVPMGLLKVLEHSAQYFVLLRGV